MAKQPERPEHPDDRLSTHDVAVRYGVSTETVRRWLRKGSIPYEMVGPSHMRLMRREDVLKHVIKVEGVQV